MKTESKTASVHVSATVARDRAGTAASPGDTVVHAELGEGVLLRIESGGYAHAFFRAHGERQVLLAALERATTWNEQVVASSKPATAESLRRLWLAIEA